MGENPSHFKGAMRPVESVSWCRVLQFCNKLSVLKGLEPCYELPLPFEEDKAWILGVRWRKDANGYRLPTEAEWEYCARAGQNTIYAGSDDRNEVGWYKNNSDEKTHIVGEKKANGFGLYDMSGNVWEWVWDTSTKVQDYSPEKPNRYPSASRLDPIVDSLDESRVLRGGAWIDYSMFARVSFHCSIFGTCSSNNSGFRVVRST